METFSAKPNEKILVVAPHPDDESIGCGGLLLTFGNQIDVLLVTDGRTAHSNEITDEKCILVRQAEFNQAVSQAKVNNHISLGLPDGKAYLCGKSLRNFDFSKYSKVFIPNRTEEHIDHRATNECIRRVLRRKHFQVQVYEYEVWSPLAFPTHYLDISTVFQKKDKLIACYESQLSIRDYNTMTQGINAYRGVSCHTAYVEAYELISAKNRRKKIYFKLPVRFQLWIMSHMNKQQRK